MIYAKYPIIILWKEEISQQTNKWKEKWDKITPNKESIWKPNKKTPNQHTQSIIQKEEEEKYDKNNEKVSTPKIKLIHLFFIILSIWKIYFNDSLFFSFKMWRLFLIHLLCCSLSFPFLFCVFWQIKFFIFSLFSDIWLSWCLQL